MAHFIKISIMPIILFLLTAPYACKSETETYTSKEGSVKIDRAGDKADITINTKDGEMYSMSVNKGDLPEEWPSEIPVIAGGSIVFSQTDAKGMTQQVSIETKQSAKDALEFYKKTFTSTGWNVENTMSMPQLQILNAKKDVSEIMLQIAEDEDKTHIHLILQKKS